ncbi:MAG: DUF2207 domain-containing protein [Dehalococcoidia bacterium]|nr:DUF2207 domain-containing protein [Dehalococcoidia bacterium]
MVIVRRATSMLVFAGILALVLLVAPASSATAQVGERIHRYEVTVRIATNGDVEILESIDYDFGSAERRGILRDLPMRFRYDDTYDRIYELDVIEVTASGGASARYAVEDIENGVTRIRVGDPDETVKGLHTYMLLYRVRGALNHFDSHDEFYWNAIGTGWGVPIDAAMVTVHAPAAIDAARCFAGPFESRLECDAASARDQSARFVHEGLGPYEGVSVVVGFPTGVVTPAPEPILEERWSLARAFTISPQTLIATGVVLVVALGAIARLLWTTGRDRRWRGSVVDATFGTATGEAGRVPLFEGGPYPVEYTPPAGLRPGEIGALHDEVVHPIDLTATIIDLATRGYLTIEEVEERQFLRTKQDWKLHRQKRSDDLEEFERLLLDGLFESGDEVMISDLQEKFVDRLNEVKEAMYALMVEQGWYRRSPERTRNVWLGAGIVVLLMSIALVVAAAAFTRWALVPVPLVIGGIVLIGAHGMTPARTPQGTAMLRRIRGFERFITSAEVYRARFAEQASLFYDYLPYAIVFGATDGWAKAFEGLDDVPAPTWYQGAGGVNAFNIAAFSSSMQSFAVSSAGTIASTPGGSGSSGFGGGGFSGGGGGGGGGGSW